MLIMENTKLIIELAQENVLLHRMLADIYLHISTKEKMLIQEYPFREYSGIFKEISLLKEVNLTTKSKA